MTILPWLAGTLALTAVSEDVPVFELLPEAQQTRLAACGVDAGELSRLLELKQRPFDQDFEGGWREIAGRDGCRLAAADAIESYMLFARPYGPEHTKILRWHAGQMYAYEQRTDKAIAYFRATYDDVESVAFPGPEWNLYVDATLAFLRGDYDALVAARDELAVQPVPEERKESRRKMLADNPNMTMPEGFIDAPMNLNVVKGLVDCFGKPYSQAYGSCEKDE
ncbi:hypothetical protein [Parvularcula marina]|uniref:Tetratricopeptide repeat protein n=1 Tax=Parvularcula marina TaxID=2292771 RepID=A0A371RK47_9PROT|nr:hypothetical protein [Parvularcula marina]RFB05835.1 hypothetical protein DX908_11495 [Parvularcula marina]